MKTGSSECFGDVHPDERLVIDDQNGNSVSRFETFALLLHHATLQPEVERQVNCRAAGVYKMEHSSCVNVYKIEQFLLDLHIFGARSGSLSGARPMRKNQNTFNLEDFLATVNGGRTLATYRKDDVVFSQGHRCDGVFYIRSGDCKISVISEQGKEAVIALHKKGDFFGEGCLTGQPLRLATATARSDLEVMKCEIATRTYALRV